MENWWRQNRFISQITDWAFEIADQYPDARIISLGQSPAWIVLSVGMIRRLRGNHANISFVPFTDNFAKRATNDNGSHTMTFDRQTNRFPHAKCLQRYFNYISRLDATPGQLIKAGEQGQQTIITEMIRSGSGLASFLSAWTDNYQKSDIETLLEHTGFHIFDTNPECNKDYIDLNGAQNIAVPLTKRPLSKEEADIIENTAPINDCSEDSSRLVPLYRLCSNNEQAGLRLCYNRPVRKKIRAILYREIEKHHRLS